MGLPLDDPQFWCVTAGAAGAVWMLVKPFLGRPAASTGGPCGGCSAAGGCRTHAPDGAPDEAGERLVVLRGGR
jgi:hypothetical protein